MIRKHLVLLALPALSLVSCVTPAPPSGFVAEKHLGVRDKSTPFQRSWVKPRTDFAKYRKVYVSPTDTTRTRVTNTFLNERRAFIKSYKDDVSKNAPYLTKSFQNAFAESKERSWEVTDRPTRSRHALLVEPALVEIGPARPVLEAGGYFVPGASILNRPMVALETRIKDARTGEVLATLADRETPPFAAVEIAKLQFYKAQRNIFRKWGKQTVRWIERADDEPIRDPLIPFTLLSW